MHTGVLTQVEIEKIDSILEICFGKLVDKISCVQKDFLYKQN